LIGQLQELDQPALMRRYGVMGARLYHLSRGEDARHVSAHDSSKSIGAETTFNADIAEFERLEGILWRLSERVSERAKTDGLAGRTITLKLKTADFRLRTRAASMADATNLAHLIFAATQPLLRKEADGTRFRLIGVAISNLVADGADAAPTLDTHYRALTKAELAIDELRQKFGSRAIGKGRALRGNEN
jgi:DNA polymerase-4